jgi:acyl dehydratase
VSRESIRLFCDASLDYNPLHLDDDSMKAISARPISAASSRTA